MLSIFRSRPSRVRDKIDNPEQERLAALEARWEAETRADREREFEEKRRLGWEPPQGHKAVARATFSVLLLLSALFGVMCGLMLVYSVDLPQIDDLVKYRPNTTSTLYDVHGRAFGSFSLERRVVVQYSDIPVNLRDAIISIEDKSFQRNWG